MYAKVESGVIVEWPVHDLQSRFPHTSFPAVLRDVDMPEGYVLVHAAALPTAGKYEKLESRPPVFNGTSWESAYEVVPLVGDELAQAVAAESAAAEAARRVAYQQESDPIFFKWQRGEATQEDWLAKIAEIKERYV